ncbi:cytochrome-c oxidase, cbb3-type subunit III [Gymnodinialimonas ceratoperidinii]|uniref:Cbb3-type cytochrome c oxidase subunit n=1 Tax=Gymnodinialimonas ceratoperidinii TaxID=2856823 RepID=A0A8F6TXB2_9RHOB|nr:cytochrome-c oxidase, cbb3-type subunit III [Gymnodinialimonas ceratoperidinii]QXT40385.1 cytochrome-c oxidase, cbb3-type subunit III [Gymnodinialimonas ceratoperidinii]
MTDQDHSNLHPDDPETTGHEWDGIREFNNPLPRWWLWCLYATILWGVAYTIAYPAWPMISGATPGLLGYSTRAEVAGEIDRYDALNADLRAELAQVDLTSVTQEGTPDLYNFAIQSGGATFATWCSQCHGRGAAGVQASGYPSLLDDDWLWGGTVEDIHLTIAHGIRNEEDPDARWSEMTAFEGILSDEEIDEVVHYVLSVSEQEADADLAMAGEAVFLDNCAACHGDTGAGDRILGAPNLTDRIWLYGGSPEAIEETVRHARFGVMPPWSGRLSEAETRATAIYVHSRGGGE